MRIQRDLRKERLEENVKEKNGRYYGNVGLGFVSLLIASMVAGLVAWMVWLKEALDECRQQKLLELKILP